MATLSTNRVVLGRLARELDSMATLAELDRVAEQVDEDLPDLLAVGTQPASLAPR
jgi:hypothetical protein